ncbi:hypothetical protein FALB51S_01720 [Frigidibacter albus]
MASSGTPSRRQICFICAAGLSPASARSSGVTKDRPRTWNQPSSLLIVVNNRARRAARSGKVAGSMALISCVS